MGCRAGLLALLLLLAEGGPEASVSDLQVAPDGNRVLASLVLRNGFGGDLVERLESGLPTPILYRFELARDRKRWWDQKLKEATLEVVATYDAVTRDYTVNYKLDDKLIESRKVRDRKALEEAMTVVDQLPVFSLAGLPPEARLLVKVAAETGSRTILSFIPVTINTDWRESPKFRAPRQP
jgi:Domain of unknown function (DUF4390)